MVGEADRFKASAPDGVALHAARIGRRLQNTVGLARRRRQAADRPAIVDPDIVAPRLQVIDHLFAEAILDLQNAGLGTAQRAGTAFRAGQSKLGSGPLRSSDATTYLYAAQCKRGVQQNRFVLFHHRGGRTFQAPDRCG